MSTGYTTVSASHLQDATGTLVANATIYFQPCSTSGSPLSFQAAGSGQAMFLPVSANVTNGVFSIQLADTTLTNPINICYAVTVVDNVTGRNLLGSGYLIQPSGATWSLDSFVPSAAPQALIQVGPTGATGPANTLSIGTVTTGAPGSSASATITGTSPTQTLNLSIPTGATGAAGTSLTLPQMATSRTSLPATANLFNSATVTTGSAINASTGAVVTLAGAVVTGYIPANSGGSMATSNASYGSGNYGYAFYDQTQTFIPGSGSTTGLSAGGTITVPSAAAYVRITYLTANITNLMVVNGTALPSTYVGFQTAATTDITNALLLSANYSNSIEGAIAPTRNLFNSATVVTGAVNHSTGVVDATQTSFSSSALIPVAGLGTISTLNALPYSNPYGVAFYDINQNYLSGLTAAVSAGGTITLPATAAYMRCYVANGAVSSVCLVAGSTAPTAVVPYTIATTADLNAAAVVNQGVVNNSLQAKAPSNLFNSSTVVTGAVNSSTGVVDATQTGDSSSNYIPVAGFSTIVASANIPVAGAYGPVWFDVNKNYLSKISSSVTAGTPITVPANAAYLRFYMVSGAVAGMILVPGTSVPSGVLPYSTANQVSTGAAAYAAAYTLPRIAPYVNLYNYQSTTQTIGALKVNGTIDTTQTSYIVSDYMPVSGLSSIISNANIPLSGGYGWCWFDVNFNLLSSLAATTSGTSVAVPSNAAYLRLYTTPNNGSIGVATLPLMVIAGSTLPPNYIPFSPMVSLFEQMANNGTIGFWGDSITNTYAWWQNQVLIRSGLKYGWKDSQNGRRTDQMLNAYSNNTPTGINQFVASQSTNTGTLGNTLTQDIANVTVMLLFTGTNDYPLASSNPGSTASTAWDGSLYGAYKGLLETLQSANPTMRILLVGPYYQVNQTDPYCTITRAAGLWAAQQHGIPYLDLMYTSGVNAQNYTQLLQPDYIHPLPAWANYRLGPQISDFVKHYL